MPQKGRGGKRVGTPGTTYGNRSDLQQAVRAAPGQPYGAAAQQLQAQQAVPLSQTPPVPPPADPTAALPALTGPTQRPNEPVTHGLPTGPGAGPKAIGMSAPVDPTVNLLKGMMQVYPNADLQAILAQAMSNH